MNETGHIVIVAEDGKVASELRARHPNVEFEVFDNTKHALLWLESETNRCDAILLGEELSFMKSELFAEILAANRPNLKECIKIFTSVPRDEPFTPWPDRPQKRARRSTLKTTLKSLLEGSCKKTRTALS